MRLFKYIKKVFPCLFLLLLALPGRAQEEDSLEHESRRNLVNINDIFHQAMNSISRNPGDTINEGALLLAKSEASYYKYAGRYVRHIIISQMGFEKKLSDTTKFLQTAGTRIYNNLHVNTRDWVIRHNLFIKEHQEVNPYELADNERYLRSLDFIQDARILVKPVKGHRDSVDLIVVTKDLFSINGSAEASGIQNLKGTLSDANFMGMGQRIQASVLLAQNRSPAFGYDLQYRKQSIARTFITATVGYSNISTGRKAGNEEESAYYLRLDRPLVSPYSHYAGGLEVSHNNSVNVYRKPDSFFYNYSYNVIDAWVGYNFSPRRVLFGGSPLRERDRLFIGLRYLNSHFNDIPFQVGDRFDPVYNSKQAVLGELTFFRQDFFKTQYIYGFGTTEDLPYGYNISLSTGWYKQIELERPYIGVDANRYIASGAGEFYQFFMRAGGFYTSGSMQDAAILFGGSVFSRLVHHNETRIRQYFRFSYSRLFNRVTYEPLRINNQFGLNDFGPDSVMGKRRINLYTETVVFTKYKVFGFRMAPFIFGNVAMITPETSTLSQSDFYTGLGGGLRTRNENLIFGTIELRAMYFPRTAYGMKGFRVTLNSNISFRYRSNYVVAPDILQLNASPYIY
ncbi:hypothetical protein ACTHGU_13270 [Chitinophagaceae bacterium MMS25-I14]